MSETIHRIVKLADQLQLSGQYLNRGAAIQEAARQCGVKQSRPCTMATSAAGAVEESSPLGRACQRLTDAARVTEEPGTGTEAKPSQSPVVKIAERWAAEAKAAKGGSVAARVTEEPGTGTEAKPSQSPVVKIAERWAAEAKAAKGGSVASPLERAVERRIAAGAGAGR